MPDRIEQEPTPRLLAAYADILAELRRREVVRSANVPAGDLAETLVARAYGGELGPSSQKSWDVRAADGRLLQVKCRVRAAGSRAGGFSFLRSWAFDACVFVNLEAQTYDVVAAVEVPMQAVCRVASHVEHVNGWRVPTSTDLRELHGAVDVTDRLRDALRSL
jgi:hypothetical protein